MVDLDDAWDSRPQAAGLRLLGTTVGIGRSGRPHLWVLAVALLLVSGVVSTLVPLIVAWTLNEGLLIAPPNATVLAVGCAAAIAGYLLIYYVDTAQSLTALKIGYIAAGRLRGSVFRSLMRANLRFLSTAQKGSYASTVTNNAAVIATVPSQILNHVGASVVGALAAMASMAFLSPSLTLIALLISVPLAVLLKGQIARTERRTVELYAAQEELLTKVTESLSIPHISLMRIYGMTERTENQFEVANQEEAAAQSRLAAAGVWRIASIGGLLAAGPVILYALLGLFGGGSLAGMAVGDLMVFTAVQARLPFGLVAVLNSAITIRGTLSIVSDVDSKSREAIQSSSLSGGGVRQIVQGGDQAICVEGVRILGGDDERPLAEDISFAVDYGEILLIRGRTGIGKTSLLRVVSGLDDPDSGKVILSRRGAVGLDYVMQTPYFFPGSIRDNLTFFAPHTPDSDVWAALGIAQLGQRVKELPNGLETRVGDGGISLSGGEYQRLALARSILRDADVILLDEATSALDVETEANVLTELYSLWSEKALIIVTHRPAMTPARAREYFIG